VSTILKITKRELMGYFTTPIGYVFIIVFLPFLWYMVFQKNDFFALQNASMDTVFSTMPLIFLLFIPAVGMRLWSEERRTGTIEILLTLPISIAQATIGKFLAAWIFILITILSTLTFVVSLNNLGSPDNGVIFANYIGITFVAGAFLSIASFTSALTKNQVISLILSFLLSFGILFLGDPGVLEVCKAIAGYLHLPVNPVIDFVGSFGFYGHMINLQKGIIDSRDIIFFISFISVMIYLNILLINKQKAK